MPNDELIQPTGHPEDAHYGGESVPPPHPDEQNLPPLSGPEGNEDPVTQLWRKENWEYDVDKAHEMALAEDDDRTAGADMRAAQKALTEEAPKYEELISNIEQKKSDLRGIPLGHDSLWPKKRKRQQAERETARTALGTAEKARYEFEEDIEGKVRKANRGLEHIGDNQSEYRHAEALALINAREGRPRDIDRHLSFMERLAEASRVADERAKAKGEWAAILHDHPPGDAFRESLSDIYEFEAPYELWDLETRLLREKRDQAEEIRSTLEELLKKEPFSLDDALEFIDMAGEEQIVDISNEDILKEFFAESRGLVKELLKMVKTEFTDDTTIAQIKEKSKEIAKLIVRIEETEVAGMERALADIRAGKADGPDYKVEEVPTEGQISERTKEAHRHLREAEKWSAVADERQAPDKHQAEQIADVHAKKAMDLAGIDPATLAPAPTGEGTDDTAPQASPES